MRVIVPVKKNNKYTLHLLLKCLESNAASQLITSDFMAC